MLQAQPSQIHIILDRPAHAGNIGAAARAMKNMGFSHLRLVSPRQFPHPDAWNFATGAGDVIDQARQFDTIADAVADLHILVATSNRPRGQRQRVVTPRQLGQQVTDLLATPALKMGLLFGTERTGLETVDVERADLLCNIPTSGYGSINLAQAVLIVTYEIMLGLSLGHSFAANPLEQGDKATAAQMDRLFQHLEQVLLDIDFVKSGQHRHLMGSLKAVLHRAALNQREVAILHGILTEVIASRDRAVALVQPQPPL
ncbi:MAG: RNA methyltransferase [Magnetococcales bacterium]|nr:RNA methyltransferase [Magnetococcales bacterium]